MSVIVPGTTEFDAAAVPINLAITLAEALGVELTDTTAPLAAAKIAAALASYLDDPESALLWFDADGNLGTVPVVDSLTNTLRTYGTDGAGAVVDRTPAEQAAHMVGEATEAGATVGFSANNGAMIQRTAAEQIVAEFGAAAANRSFGWDGSNAPIARTPAEQLVASATGYAAVSVTGSGEVDIAVTAATSVVRIAPTGNMTIDDVTGLLLGQALLVCLKQDTSDRTLALAGGTNCVLRDAGALSMPAGSGAIAHALLVGEDNGSGTVVPAFYEV